MRLTKNVREALLQLNDGFETSTYYTAKNFKEQRDYTIVDGQLQVRSRGKTSWADSRFDNTFVADDAATHRFLRTNLYALNTDGIEAIVDTIASASAAKASATAAADVESVDLEDPSPDLDSESDSESDEGGSHGTTAVRPPNINKTAVWVIAGVVTVAAAVAVAPRVKRLWREHVQPRVKRLRGKVAEAQPVEASGTVENPGEEHDSTPESVQ